ncbi:MAG: FYDLN acid domain-containing protein [Pseudomonadota bacterium]
MAKPEWGTKQTCPKCGARFYDMTKEPAQCVSCGHEFIAEPVLKSKQPLPEEARKPVKKPEKAADEDDDDLVDDDDIEVEDDDEALADVSLDDDDADLSEVVDNSLEENT